MKNFTLDQKQVVIFLMCLACSVVSFLIFGKHMRTWADAAGYNALGVNIAQHGSYSIDGTNININREPGYPAFLALVYLLFGPQNLLAVSFIQCLMYGLLGFFVYRLLRPYDGMISMIAGCTVSFLPSYGYYSTEIPTESLFAFLLGAIFMVAVKIFYEPESVSWRWYALLGILCGYESLVRVQFLLFLPFAVFVWALVSGKLAWQSSKKIVITFLIFLLPVAAWVVYVHKKTGTYAITSGRQEVILDVRANRAQLSYADNTRYAAAWIMRSVSGGVDDLFLDIHDIRYVGKQYSLAATTSEAVALIEKRDIQTIEHNPGHFLYGNLIEMVKLAYIEHDYVDSQSRYFRPTIYALMYAFFLFGLYQIFRSRDNWDLKSLSLIIAVFVSYNYLTVSFFDAIPRYNTPYLFFYIIIGFVGVILFRRGRDHLQA
jgi:4-amino-4-deoxy-L-arabinose transferase-like glycosyltransferase